MRSSRGCSTTEFWFSLEERVEEKTYADLVILALSALKWSLIACAPASNHRLYLRLEALHSKRVPRLLDSLLPWLAFPSLYPTDQILSHVQHKPFRSVKPFRRAMMISCALCPPHVPQSFHNCRSHHCRKQLPLFSLCLRKEGKMGHLALETFAPPLGLMERLSYSFL